MSIADKYRHRIPEVVRYCEQQMSHGAKSHDLPGLTTMYTGIPIYVCCLFVIELYGMSPELERLVGILKTFYGSLTDGVI